MSSVPFDRRPSASPAIAAMAQRERPRDITSRTRVIEIGCGDGVDSIVLAQAGARSVLGLDNEPGPLATARRRCKTLGLASARFEHVDLPDALEAMRPSCCDVLVDTLAFDNIADGDPRRERRLVLAIAHVLANGGRWMIHARVNTTGFDLVRAASLFPRVAREHFLFGFAFPTHLVEYPFGDPRYVRAGGVVFTVAHRRRR